MLSFALKDKDHGSQEFSAECEGIFCTLLRAVGVVVLEQEHGLVGVSGRFSRTVHQVGGQAICQVFTQSQSLHKKNIKLIADILGEGKLRRFYIDIKGHMMNFGYMTFGEYMLFSCSKNIGW